VVGGRCDGKQGETTSRAQFMRIDGVERPIDYTAHTWHLYPYECVDRSRGVSEV
jgi:hypothetical protein